MFLAFKVTTYNTSETVIHLPIPERQKLQKYITMCETCCSMSYYLPNTSFAIDAKTLYKII